MKLRNISSEWPRAIAAACGLELPYEKRILFQNSGASLYSCGPITDTDPVPKFWKMPLNSGKKTLPCKGGHHPVPSLSIIPTERRVQECNVLTKTLSLLIAWLIK